MTTTRTIRYTPADVAMFRKLQRGADVFGYGEAMRLRELQRQGSDAFEITPRMGQYDGAEQLPYFGAILTNAGRELLKRRGGQRRKP